MNKKRTDKQIFNYNKIINTVHNGNRSNHL